MHNSKPTHHTRRHSIDSPRGLIDRERQIVRRLESRLHSLKAGISVVRLQEQALQSPDFYISRLSRRYQRWLYHETANQLATSSPGAGVDQADIVPEAAKFDLLMSVLGPDSPLLAHLYPEQPETDADAHVSPTALLSPLRMTQTAGDEGGVCASPLSVVSPDDLLSTASSPRSVPRVQSACKSLTAAADIVPAIINTMDHVIEEVMAAVQESGVDATVGTTPVALSPSCHSTPFGVSEGCGPTPRTASTGTRLLRSMRRPDRSLPPTPQQAKVERLEQMVDNLLTRPAEWTPRANDENELNGTPALSTRCRRSARAQTPALTNTESVHLRQSTSYSQHVRRIRAARQEAEQPKIGRFDQLYRKFRATPAPAPTHPIGSTPRRRGSAQSQRTPPKQALQNKRNMMRARPHRLVDWQQAAVLRHF